MSKPVQRFGWRFLRSLYANNRRALSEAFGGGDHAVVKLPLFAPIYLSRSSELAAHLFRNDDELYSRREAYGFKGLAQALENGVLTAEGETWQKMREHLQPAFHRKQMDAYMRDIAASAAAARRQIRGFADSGEAFAGFELARRLAVEVIGKTIVGSGDLERLDRIQLYSDNATYYAMHWTLFGRGVLGLLLWPLVLCFYYYKYRLVQECNRILDHATAGANSFDMITTMRTARAGDGQPLFSRRDIRNQVATMVIAGYKTTASLLTAALYELACQPQVAQKLREELAGRQQHGIDSMAELKQLPYLEAVIKEVLRLHPSVQWVMRKVKQNVNVAELALPQDSMCFVNLGMLHRHAKYWKDPEAFVPERHLTRDDELPNSRIYFGMGKRTCLGKDLAVLEAKLLLVALVPEFGFEIVEDHDYNQGFTLLLSYQRPVIFKARAVGAA
ncbi:MAG TPA: cytochrome P450 [Candidatus Acidoferrum sp.]|nr:cytochrome P450 [Candidatus Acidoferrum sp.]